MTEEGPGTKGEMKRRNRTRTSSYQLKKKKERPKPIAAIGRREGVFSSE